MVFPWRDKYIHLLTDFGFKRVFGTESNKALLMDFLNTLLPAHHQIQDVTIKTPEFFGNSLVNRIAIFDSYCQSTTGERFMVEIQKADHNFFKDPSVYYGTFPIQEQAQLGNWDDQLTAVYTVGILDFIFNDHKDNPELLHLVELNNHHCELLYDKLTSIYIELPKFTKSVDQLETHFDKWLFLLKHLGEFKAPPESFPGDVFAQLFKVAEIANFSPKEQALYYDSLKVYRDMYSVVQTCIQEGFKQGRLEGLKQAAIEQGKLKVKQQVAKRMKAAGLPLKDIAQYTELSEEVIIKWIN